MTIQAPNKSTKKRASKFYHETLNERIRNRLKECKIKPAELARRLEVSVEAVRQWCGGYSQPSIKNIPAIARELECSCNYLLGATDNMIEKNEAIGERLGLDDHAISALEGSMKLSYISRKTLSLFFRPVASLVFFANIENMMENIIPYNSNNFPPNTLKELGDQISCLEEIDKQYNSKVRAITPSDYLKFLKYRVHEELDNLLDYMEREARSNAQEARE